MRAKPGITKDTVFSFLCKANLDTVATGGRSIELQTQKGHKVIFKHHTYRIYPPGVSKWEWQVVLQWFKSGKIPKNNKMARVRV